MPSNFESMFMSRILDFDNILNARDFGGYEGAYGRLAMGKLLRTANLANASNADLFKLKTMDVGLIVDLRYLSERERQPNKWPEGTATQTLAFDATRTGQAPHEAFTQNELNAPEDAVRYMTGNYAERPGHPGFQKIFRDTLEHLAQTGDTFIVHCAAGKDRTGTLVALIQALLGVNPDDIMQDYMLTMKAVDVDGILKMAAPLISKRHGREISADALRPMFGVQESYLEAGLKAMGDPVKYAYDVLGLSAASHARLRAHYIQA